MMQWKNFVIGVLALAFAQVGLRSLWGIGIYLYETSSMQPVPATIVGIGNYLDTIPGGPSGQASMNRHLKEVRYRIDNDTNRIYTTISFQCGACKATEISALFGGVPLDSLVGKTVTAYVSQLDQGTAYLFFVDPKLLLLEALKALVWIVVTSTVVIVVGRGFVGKKSDDE